MAVALSGAVLLGDDGRMIRYQKKCERCGHLDPGSTLTQAPRGSSVTLTSGFMCPKCRSHNEVRIRGS